MADERGVRNEVSGIVFGNVVQARDVVGVSFSPSADGPLGWPIRDVADPFALEVHPAIDAGPDVALLPSYVERDHDVRLREVVSRAVDGTSGIVVLVGGSSTGKTRACWEALRFVPDDWRLWHPIDPGRPEAAAAALSRVEPRTLVWMNEIHHYLRAPGIGERIAAGLRELLRRPDRGPVLVLGTIWPEHWATLTAPPMVNADPHAHARSLLTGADLSVPEAFIGAALEAMRVAATDDPRLAEAITQAADGRISQFLAGVPALLDRYRNAPPAPQALIDAAMDARRLGHGPTLPHALLLAAAPGYLTDYAWEYLDEDWFEQAIGYVGAPCRGVRGPLTRIHPRPGQAIPEESCYRLADYLEQHARTVRRAYRVPETLWESLVAHATPADAAGIATNAADRLLYCYAIPLYRRATDVNSYEVTERRADLLARGGHLEELRARGNAGDRSAAFHLGRLLADSGELDEAIDVLRMGADAGHAQAAYRLAELLAERGDLDEAIIVLHAHADAGNNTAAFLLVELLAKHRVVDLLRVCAERGDEIAAYRLVDLWVERGDIDALRAFADTGNDVAASRLASVLAAAGDLDGLRSRVDSGDQVAANWLADLLAQRGGIDELRARVTDGDGYAANRLAELLVKQARVDEALEVLRVPAETGDGDAAHQMATVLAERGDIRAATDVLRACANAGSRSAARRLSRLFAERGDVAGLRSLTDAGDRVAAIRLARLLTKRGDVEEAIAMLRVLADADNAMFGELIGEQDKTMATMLTEMLTFMRFWHRDKDQSIGDAVVIVDGKPSDWQLENGDVADQLAQLLVQRGDIAELRARARVGDRPAAYRLAELLDQQNDLDGAIKVLQASADLGDRTASRQAARLLVERDDIDRLRALADAGNVNATLSLVDLLVERGDIDGLQARIEIGDALAGHHLVEVLNRQNRHDEANRLRRFGLKPDGTIASGS